MLAQRVHALNPALARQKSSVLRTKIGLAEGRRRGQPVCEQRRRTVGPRAFAAFRLITNWNVSDHLTFARICQQSAEKKASRSRHSRVAKLRCKAPQKRSWFSNEGREPTAKGRRIVEDCGELCSSVTVLAEQWSLFLHPAKPMLTTVEITERVRNVIALAARTEDARARDILIDLACMYQALAVRVAKRERADQQERNRAA